MLALLARGIVPLRFAVGSLQLRLGAYPRAILRR